MMSPFVQDPIPKIIFSFLFFSFSRPHPMVHRIMGGNTRTTFPLLRMVSIYKGGGGEKGGGERK
jgi:hypothetical protein